MATDLSPDNQQFLRQLINRGEYADEAAVLNEAVRVLRIREELAAELRIGRDQADRGELLPGDEVLERFERRAAEIENGSTRL